jgi:ribonuclease HI
MKQVQIITEGSCIGNPGPGGWACILRYGTERRELSGSEAQTTNNRMELAAAINGLKAWRETCDVELVTDSQYLKQGITQYLARWKTNGWRTADRRPVQNQDLWRELDELASRHIIRWTWVVGHGDHDRQNRCDALAQAAARREAVIYHKAERSMRLARQASRSVNTSRLLYRKRTRATMLPT